MQKQSTATDIISFYPPPPPPSAFPKPQSPMYVSNFCTSQVLRFPLFQLPQLVTQLVNARVALTRLEELLAASQQDRLQLRDPATKGHSLPPS